MTDKKWPFPVYGDQKQGPILLDANQVSKRGFLYNMNIDEALDVFPSKTMTPIEPDQILHIYNKKSLDNITHRLENNMAVDPPTITIDPRKCEVVDHEGRHRIMASKMLGFETIPMYIKYSSNVWIDDVLDSKAPCCLDSSFKIRPDLFKPLKQVGYKHKRAVYEMEKGKCSIKKQTRSLREDFNSLKRVL